MSETFGTRTAASESEDVVLDITDAEVTFEMARGRARVLDNINLQIERGETFCIIGESGCGKSMFGSSLLNAVDDPGQLSGEITYYPDEGEPINLLELNNRQLRQVRWDEISIVFQGAMNAFNPTHDMRTHFTETLATHNRDPDEGMERARELLEDVNLNPDRILDSYQHELSGGERQRTLLALSLLLEPEVLILDEPTAALDLLMQRKILRLLHDIKEEHDLTLLLISHDIPVIAGFADRVAVMYAFRHIERGDAEDILLNPEHPYTRMLLQSTLSLDVPIEEISTIPGTTPDPVNVPQGCPYHPRCPVSEDRCEEEDPVLQAPEGSNHELACFYPDAARAEIPVSITQEGDQ
jgi:oligopeptide/dipeptide ABC transporter ATP-binding protein